VGNNYFLKVDESDNKLPNEETVENSDDTEEFDLMSVFPQQMEKINMAQNQQKKDNFVNFLDNITITSLMDYETEILDFYTIRDDDAIQLLSLLHTSNAVFIEKVGKWGSFPSPAKKLKWCLAEEMYSSFLATFVLMPQKLCLLWSIGLKSILVHPFWVASTFCNLTIIDET